MRRKGKFETARTSEPTPAPKKAPSAPEQKAPSAPVQKGSKKKLGAGGIVLICLAALLVLAVLGLAAYGNYLKGQDTIFPNVYVAGINVGGLKRDAAVLAVEDAVETKTADNTLNVVLPDRTIAFTPEVTQVALNADEAVDQALGYGREGGAFSTLLSYQYAKKNDYHVDLQSSLNLDTAYIRDLIDKTAYAAKTDKIEPIVRVDNSKRNITVTVGSPALSLDADRLYELVLDRFGTGDFTDLYFDYDQDPCKPVELESYYKKYCKGIKDAYYDEKKKQIVPEETGYGFDLPYYTQQLALAKPGSVVNIELKDLQPEVTAEKLGEIYFHDVLAQYDSPHTNQTGRTKNLELACKQINGTILNPGEEFSFNKTVGERTAEKGYQAAIVYTNGGKSEAEAGGGVCQVASTIYTCCLLADLKVTERAPHMYLVTYVEKGMDATIYWGQLDYKFVNSSEYPLRIDASVSGGYVHIKLVGTDWERDYDSIKLRGETVNVKEWKTVIENENASEDKKVPITIEKGAGLDKNGNPIDLAVDGQGNKYVLGASVNSPYTGYTIKAYRDFYDKDGQLLRSELLHTDIFNVRHQSYEVTPYVEPEVVKPEDPEESTDDKDPEESGDSKDPKESDEREGPQNPFGPDETDWWD